MGGPDANTDWGKQPVSAVRASGGLPGNVKIPIETVSPEGTFCDTVQVPSGAGDMQLI